MFYVLHVFVGFSTTLAFAICSSQCSKSGGDEHQWRGGVEAKRGPEWLIIAQDAGGENAKQIRNTPSLTQAGHIDPHKKYCTDFAQAS